MSRRRSGRFPRFFPCIFPVLSVLTCSGVSKSAPSLYSFKVKPVVYNYTRLQFPDLFQQSTEPQSSLPFRISWDKKNRAIEYRSCHIWSSALLPGCINIYGIWPYHGLCSVDHKPFRCPQAVFADALCQWYNQDDANQSRNNKNPLLSFCPESIYKFLHQVAFGFGIGGFVVGVFAIE